MASLRVSMSIPVKPTVPQSSSEAILYCVLEKANLTQYFGDFIAQGGDDVRQLCEAGEDEFLEIMALVGMASKPLHVRRLQKALQEWSLYPERFKVASKHVATNQSHETENGRPTQGHSLLKSLITQPPNSFLPTFHTGSKSHSPVSDTSDQELNAMQNDMILHSTDNRLSDLQILAIEQAALEHSEQLPMYAPKPLNAKKPHDREIEEVMSLPTDDEGRLDAFRKYAAIYGRFDSKRNRTKQLNFHEMCVNEAAAQLCLHRPSLMTRREDLFLQARRVVKEAGLQLTRVQYRSRDYPLGQTLDEDSPPPLKRSKSEVMTEFEATPSNGSTKNNGRSSLLTTHNLFQMPLSWPKDSLFNSGLPSPSKLLLAGHEDNDDLKTTLKGEGELSLLEEGLRIARQYGLSAFNEEPTKVKDASQQA